MKINRVPNLVSFLGRFFLFSTSSHQHNKLISIFPKSNYEIKHTYVFLMFLALCLFIGAIFLRGSSKQSSDIEDSQCHSIKYLSMLDIDLLYPLAYKVDEELLLDETYYSLTNIVNEYEDEDDDQEFIPRIVHLELIEGAKGNHESDKDFISRLVHVKLMEGPTGSDEKEEEFHGYDDYDEDNDDEGDEDDVDIILEGNDHDDLQIRSEKFIAKTIRKWKEEMLDDKFLYLEY